MQVSSSWVQQKLGLSRNAVRKAKARGALVACESSRGGADFFWLSDVELYMRARYQLRYSKALGVLALCQFLGRFA